MHLADSNDGSGDVSFSYAVTSAGLSSLPILIYTSLFVLYLEFNWCLVPLVVSRSSVTPFQHKEQDVQLPGNISCHAILQLLEPLGLYF